MSLPLFHTDPLDISDYLDSPSNLLSLHASSENTILIVGPDLLKWETSPDQGYMERLLKGMVEWLTQKEIIQDRDIVHELHTLLHNGALVPLAYTIEEYLATTQSKKRCLKTVLFPDNQVKKIHCELIRIPHRGYITTTYDTSIESAYAQNWHSKLRKFYLPSLAQVTETSQKKQPFILKLYGDLDEPDSIRLGHRLLTGLYAEEVREQLRQLFSETRAIFIGFDEADEDLTALQNLVKDGYIVHQINPTSIVEQVASIPRTLSQKELLLAVNTLPRATTATRKRTTSRASTPPGTQQDSREETQRIYKIPIDVGIYYAPKDESYKDEIETLLNSLKTKEGKPYEIDYKSWAMDDPLSYKSDRGTPLLSKKLVILLLSRHFFGSKYYNVEYMRKVVKRHQQGALICPILVSTCDWRGRQFDSLEEDMLPKRDTSIAALISQGKDEGEVYKMISNGLEYALGKLAGCLPENDGGV